MYLIDYIEKIKKLHNKQIKDYIQRYNEEQDQEEKNKLQIIINFHKSIKNVCNKYRRALNNIGKPNNLR